jgi:putative ABC transport system ATP-binding protein
MSATMHDIREKTVQASDARAGEALADDIRATGLTKTFRTGKIEARVLKGVDFSARHGDVTMVMGPSGSGKSTLVAALSGLMRPDSGEVTALGQKLWKMSPGKIDKFRLDHCGFIFQGFNLFASLTALQQVTIVLKYKGFNPEAAKEKAVEALTEVGLGKRLHLRPSELSGGEKQRVAIARAISKRPQLLFADEPTSALDSENGQVVIRLLKRAAKEHGAAVICVTHDPRLEEYADRVIHIEDGLITNTPSAHGAPAAPADPAPFGA